MDLISVIVPIYNVEKYLDRCVKSIVDQTYTNLEIILVDDGSPDNCPAMCDAWAARDSRIKVIHKQNGGLSDARNAGLKIATGEFISFIDSDDWIDLDFYQILYSTSIETNSEIVACELLEVYDEKSSHIRYDGNVECYTPEEALSTLIEGKIFKAIACNKLYKKQLLIGEHFERGVLHEDEFFTYRILAKANNLAFVNKQLYFYYQRSGSITNQITAKHFAALNAYKERLEFFKLHYPNLYKKDRISIIYACLNFYVLSYTLPKHEQKTCKNIVKNCRSSISFSFNEFFSYGIKDKLYILSTKYFINITSKILSKTRKA